jgi:hypothetical protein
MQQQSSRAIPLRYLAAWVAVFLAIMFYLQGWPGASIERWSELLISSLIGGGLFAWLHQRSSFRIK